MAVLSRSHWSVRVALTTLLGLGAALAPVGAQVPTTMSYQGRLLQNTPEQGVVAGTVDIDFSIWSGPASDAGATQLWTESWTGVQLSNGVFSVLLGSNGSPLVPADFQGDDSLYLQLAIDGETMLPRQQLGSVPFAVVDEPANELQDLELNGDALGLTGSSVTVDLSSYTDVDNQVLSLNGDDLELTSDDGTDTVDLSGFLDDTDEQTLSLSTNTLSISKSGSSVSLAGFLDNTDNQALSLSGNNLQLTSDDGTDVVSLAGYVNTDNQVLSLSGTSLRLTSDDGTDTVSLAGFLDNTDNQDIASVLAAGTNAGDRDITNLDDVSIDQLTVDNTFTCDASSANCIDTEHIEQDAIGGNDISDNIYILHIDCNGSCADMSMRDACNVIENLRGLSTEVELIGVSCVHDIPSTSGNGFVACDDGTEVHGDNECRAFNLRTLGDIPCLDGDGTDALVTCLETDIPK